jgi:glycosyltransferase involved in cell wall biosynthesis
MFNDARTPASTTTLAKTILMTTDAVSDVLPYTLTLASELAKAGTKVHLAVMGPKQRPEQEAAARAIPGVVIHESTYALEWMNEPWTDIARAADWLRNLERDVRPDIIHLNGYCHGAAGFTTPVVIVAHACVLSWWEAAFGGSSPERHATYKEAVRRGLQAAGAVIAVSQTMRASLERHYGPLSRVAVIPYGLSVERPNAGAHEKEHFILTAGRIWDRSKDLDALARIAKQLPWPVKIVERVPTVSGHPEHPGGEKFEPGSTGTGERGVEALGWLPPTELAGVMDRAAIFVQPSRYEPFGITALEAALRGCALVLGDIPSLRDVWGDAAVYVRPDDEMALSEAITTLANDDARRSELAASANLRAQLFTPMRNARAMRDVYEAITMARRLPAVIGAQGRQTRSA